MNFLIYNNICFNCLNPFYRKSNCKNTTKCHKCETYHHTFLNLENHFEPIFGRDKLIKISNNASGLTAAAKVFEPAASNDADSDSNSITEFVIYFSITSFYFDFGSDSLVQLYIAIVKMNVSPGTVVYFVEVLLILEVLHL